MGEYAVLRLKPEDYEKCGNIWDMRKEAARAEKWRREIESGNRMVLVCAKGGEYCGEGALVFQNDDPDYTVPGQRVYLSHLVVKTGCRGRGVGGLLTDALIAEAARLGYREIALGVDTDNLPARRLYEKKGFATVLFEGRDEAGPYLKLLKKLPQPAADRRTR